MSEQGDEPREKEGEEVEDLELTEDESGQDIADRVRGGVRPREIS